MRDAFVVRSRSAHPARSRPTSAIHDARLTRFRLRRNGMSYEVGEGHYAEPVRGVVTQGKPSSCCNSDVDCRRVHGEAQLLLCKRLGCRGSAAHASFHNTLRLANVTRHLLSLVGRRTKDTYRSHIYWLSLRVCNERPYLAWSQESDNKRRIPPSPHCPRCRWINSIQCKNVGLPP
jgi:hypothetical protein